jgi:plastocyanin
MRQAKWILAATLFALAACGNATGYGGGPTPPPPPPPPPPPVASGQIVVGNILFRSAHNGTQNPAVDTVAVGSTVTWTWTATGTTAHSVQSDAAPSFENSAIETGNGKTYSVTFNTAGTYQYDCAVHGSAMRGTIVVR